MTSRVTGALLAVALVAGPATVIPAAADQPPPQQSVGEVLDAVTPYASTWTTVPQDIGALTAYTDALTAARRQYQVWGAVLAPQLQQLQTRTVELTKHLADLRGKEASLAAALAAAQAEQTRQERTVGALVRLLYQQPSPQLHAIEQILEGEDLRAFEHQDMVTSVLQSHMAELARVRAQVDTLQQQLDKTRADLSSTAADLQSATKQRDAVAAKAAVVEAALQGIAADASRAQARIDAILAAEEARLRAAAAAAAKAAADAKSSGRFSGSARPMGGGTPARASGEFSARVPSWIPFRDTFLTYGLRYRVEPSLLAAIAVQESGLNPWAGCSGGGGGKGIMQQEGKPEYCGPDAVPASVERAAIMLAAYYNASGSWTAAVFAYNNGPGLLDEWVRYSGDRGAILSVLAAYYNAQPYASPGPKDGYNSWGEWRARVAYSYAAADPLPGFASATQKWLIFRQG